MEAEARPLAGVLPARPVAAPMRLVRRGPAVTPRPADAARQPAPKLPRDGQRPPPARPRGPSPRRPPRPGCPAPAPPARSSARTSPTRPPTPSSEAAAAAVSPTCDSFPSARTASPSWPTTGTTPGQGPRPAPRPSSARYTAAPAATDPVPLVRDRRHRSRQPGRPRARHRHRRCVAVRALAEADDPGAAAAELARRVREPPTPPDSYATGISSLSTLWTPRRQIKQISRFWLGARRPVATLPVWPSEPHPPGRTAHAPCATCSPAGRRRTRSSSGAQKIGEGRAEPLERAPQDRGRRAQLRLRHLTARAAPPGPAR
ncbi:hypothetical protein SALBM217S_04068 [Streptomyces griseoloalbus]